MTLSWWRMTKERLAELAVLPGPPALNLRLVPYTSKAPTRGNSQRHMVAWVLLLPPNLSPTSLIARFLTVSHSRDRVEQAVRGDDCGTAAIVRSPHAIIVTPPLPEQPQDQGGSVLDEEEWEIIRIVGKRRRGKGYEYKVCWKKTWLLEHGLGKRTGTAAGV
ncbi:hypothetical protein ABVK25_010780 [Lepraria finkii]|uniref:Chromo domain-containing protein n=1 Tax=Lepraria finkii TaxID=1340010 RepID=A0ABR4ATA5_9LECA